MEPETKSLTLELKADGEGAFSATFSTLNVIDHHGDVTVPGAFTDGAEVLIGGYQHDMMSLPVGKGVIQSDGGRAWVDGAFFTDTGPGLDTYKTVKNAGGLIEWSYIYNVQKASEGEADQGGVKVPVRYLEKLDVWSVDPVLKGAGIGTGTTGIKNLSHGLTFLDHAEGISQQVEAFLIRVKERAELRTKEGRTLSGVNVDRLAVLAESLRTTAKDLEQLMADANPPKTDLTHAFVQYQRSLAVLSGLIPVGVAQ